MKEINTDSPLSLKISTKKFVKGENTYIDNISLKVGIAKDIVLKDGTFVLIDIHQVIPAGNKELNETRGKVISDYQNALESEWISNLKSKYSVKIDVEVLHSLIK